MPAIEFPESPELNDEFTSGNRTWIWNGVAWEAYGTYIGATGPTGPTGSAASIEANAPITYSDETIGLDYNLGLTLSGNALAVYVSDPLTISGGAVTLSFSEPLVVTSNALTVNTSALSNAAAVETLTNKTLQSPREKFVVNTSSQITTGTSINVAAGAVVVYTTNPTSNAAVTLSLGASGTVGSMANTLPNTGDSITIGVLNPAGASFARFINVIQIDGSATNVTTQWQLGAVPTLATTSLSSTDSYLFTVVNVNTATSPKTYRVYASRTRYA